MPEPFAINDQNSEAIGSSDKTKFSIAQNSPWLKYALTEVQTSRMQKSERDNNASPSDLILDAGYNVVYQGGQSWITSLGQLADDGLGSGTKYADMVSILPRPEEASYRSNRWYAQQLGAGVGFFVPFAITHAGLKTAGLSVAARTEETVASTGKLFSGANGIRLCDSAITGFVADFTLKPLDANDGSHLKARTKNGITGAAVMTTLTAGSLGLRQASRSLATALVGEGIAKQTGRIAYDGGVGVLSGVPAGAASAEAHARLFEGRGATGEEFARSIYTTSWTGGMLSAGHVLGRDPKVIEAKEPSSNRFGNKESKGILSTTLEKLNDYRYRAKWAVQDGTTEAKRTTYAFLNKYDMRHPIQRLNNAFRSPEIEAPRVKLTPENNPVTAFEREFPQFLKEIEAKERLMDETKDRKEQYEIHKQMGEVRADFAVKLLKMWNGTPEQPGIKSLSDAELATADVTAGRVAQIRSALTQNAKGTYPSASPLTESLLALSPKEVEGNWSNYDLLGELEIAKERFYGYSVDGLNKTMSMPRDLAIKDHEYDTPVDWMPNKRSADVADLYHGTVSGSLSSILTERTMLPARELRLRGITQTTGESANEDYGRKNISLTRDFTEAYAYHRHSPALLTGFPMVFGISRYVSPRTWSAGMLEKGELLIDKLAVGKTLGTRLGLKSQDITHLFVPDAEVTTVQKQLQAYRINGLQVIGFNNMKSPEWIPEKRQEVDAAGKPIDQMSERFAY